MPSSVKKVGSGAIQSKKKKPVTITVESRKPPEKTLPDDMVSLILQERITDLIKVIKHNDGFVIPDLHKLAKLREINTDMSNDNRIKNTLSKYNFSQKYNTHTAIFRSNSNENILSMSTFDFRIIPAQPVSIDYKFSYIKDAVDSFLLIRINNISVLSTIIYKFLSDETKKFVYFAGNFKDSSRIVEKLNDFANNFTNGTVLVNLTHNRDNSMIKINIAILKNNNKVAYYVLAPIKITKINYINRVI